MLDNIIVVEPTKYTSGNNSQKKEKFKNHPFLLPYPTEEKPGEK